MPPKPTRRVVLKTIASAAAVGPSGPSVAADPLQNQPGSLDVRTLGAIGDAVLPSELGASGRAEVVKAFVRWIREYHEDADMDHGYGFTRIRRTGPSPVRRYPAQLAALDRAAAQRKPGGSLASLPIGDRRAVIADALRDATIDRLPGRPSGGHIASDLMAFYFNSSDAHDLCYEARIGRDTCRGLPGSERPPESLARRGSRGGR